MIPDELITMGVSAVSGFALKYMANSQENTRQLLAGDLESRAEARADDNGIWVRRFIVLVAMGLLAMVMVGPAFLDANTVIVQDGWFWTTTTEIKGMVYDDTFRLILVSIVGFYFGTSSASK